MTVRQGDHWPRRLNKSSCLGCSFPSLAHPGLPSVCLALSASLDDGQNLGDYFASTVIGCAGGTTLVSPQRARIISSAVLGLACRAGTGGIHTLYSNPQMWTLRNARSHPK